MSTWVDVIAVELRGSHESSGSRDPEVPLARENPRRRHLSRSSGALPFDLKRPKLPEVYSGGCAEAR